MKKLIFVLLFGMALLFNQEANAQFGARVGANFANFDGFDFDSRTGLHAGIYYGLPLMDKLVIEPAIFYSQKGYKSADNSASGRITENLDYIDIPVLVRYQILEGLNLFAGPQGSFLFSRKYEQGGMVSKTKEVVRGYDIAGVIGAGANLPLGFNVQASYDFGLVDLNYFNFNVKNRVFKLALGKNF
ncbi:MULTISPECIES: porin family protein [Rhodonellum]|nr:MULTISPECIES: porin family protein [Rhodonellum]SDZ55824.1 Outer membrane protein beta-barrel domain-containing protein [Rhodonellum ikkaensis]